MKEESFDVFLAYSSKDKFLIKNLYRKLKERGINPWFDEEVIAPGARFQDKIQDTIRLFSLQCNILTKCYI